MRTFKEFKETQYVKGVLYDNTLITVHPEKHAILLELYSVDIDRLFKTYINELPHFDCFKVNINNLDYMAQVFYSKPLYLPNKYLHNLHNICANIVMQYIDSGIVNEYRYRYYRKYLHHIDNIIWNNGNPKIGKKFIKDYYTTISPSNIIF